MSYRDKDCPCASGVYSSDAREAAAESGFLGEPIADAMLAEFAVCVLIVALYVLA